MTGTIEVDLKIEKRPVIDGTEDEIPITTEDSESSDVPVDNPGE